MGDLSGRHLVLRYDYVDDIVERRGPFREAHLAHLGAARERGLVISAGALGDPPTGALIVLRDDAAAARDLAENDPYVRNGLVTSWHVETWNVVV